MSNNIIKILFLFGCVLFFCLYQLEGHIKKYQEQKIQVINLQKQIDSIQSELDSIHLENYPCQIQLSRYEVAFEIFSRRNPKASYEFGTIISEETE